MRVRQKYDITRKPRNVQELSIAINKLTETVRNDLSKLSEYLEEGEAIRVDWKGKTPSDAFKSHSLAHKDETESYYHMKGLTLRIGISTHTKGWLIPDAHGKKQYQIIPKGADVIIDIHGTGSSKLRQDMRKKVFGEESRIYIKTFE